MTSSIETLAQAAVGSGAEPAKQRGAELPAGRAPDFFIVGHFKCGTTALYEMLKGHPQVFMPETKELWFFSPELRSRDRKPSSLRPETLEEYLALFAAAAPGQRAGEASPSYLMSHAAAERIAEVRPDARIVAILREPAAFLRSFHLQCVRNHVETETDLRKALSLEQARREGREIPRFCARPHELLYSDHVRYTEQLERYRAVFPEKQILVLIYEDFRRENEATVRRVQRFLDVDDTVSLGALEANRSVRVRSQRLHELTQSVSLGRGPLSRGAKAAIKSVTPRGLRRRALTATRERVVYADTRPPDAALTLELKRRFKPHAQAVSEHLGRDLVGLWGYDQLD